MDAIQDVTDIYTAPVTLLPPRSQFNSNFWEPIGFPAGASVPGSADNINVNAQWGKVHSHVTIDDDIDVKNLIRARVETKVSK